MAKDIFELSVITFSAQITAGHKTATTATFKVFKNGNPLGSLPTPIKDRKALIAWPVLPLGDDEDPYTLTAKMEVESKEYNITESYKVWPRWVHFTGLRASDARLFQHFKFRIKQAGSNDLVLTDRMGAFLHFLKKPAPFEVTAEAPGEFISWPIPKGRKRVFFAQRKYKAEFVAPTKPADGKPVEQIVNHRTTDKGRDKKGSLVTVKVGALGDTTRLVNDRLGHENDVIFVKATFSRANKRNAPLPTLSAAEAVTLSADKKVCTAKVRLGALGAAGNFELELGLAGGDTCELAIGTTEACSDAKMSFVNWRKLYYQMTLPSGLAEPSMADMTASLKKSKVVYEKYKTLTYAEADTPAAPAGSWFDGPMVSSNLSGRCCNIGDHNRGFFHAKFVDTHNPVGVHLLVCHVQFDGGVGNAQLAHFDLPTAITKTSAKIKFPPGGATEAFGWRLDASSTGGQVLEMAFQDGGKGWRNVTWRTTDASGPHVGKNGSVPDDHVDVKWLTRRNIVNVKLPPDAVTAINAGATVTVSLDVYYSKGTYNGEAVKNKQLIRVRPPADGGDKGMNGTMTHELGHTMKQVQYSTPPGFVAGDHGRMYSARGHQGQHCADGIAAAVFTGGGSLKGRTDCACVMYGEGATERPVDFCARCSPFLIAEDLGNLTT